MKPINLTYEEASAILELAENSLGGCDDTDDSDALDVLSTPEDVAASRLARDKITAAMAGAK